MYRFYFIKVFNALRNDDNLKNFRTSSHERIIGMFIGYDKKRIDISRANLVSELTERRREALAKYPEFNVSVNINQRCSLHSFIYFGKRGSSEFAK